MKRLFAIIMAISLSMLVFTGCSGGNDEAKKDYQYYTAEEVKDSIEKNEDIILLDIQVKEEWDKHHIKGAIETNAYPVKTDEEKAKLDPVLPTIEGNGDPVVIVCPGGAGGAERTHAYLVEKGIDKDRLFILKDGQSKWPYDELLEK